MQRVRFVYGGMKGTFLSQTNRCGASLALLAAETSCIRMQLYTLRLNNKVEPTMQCLKFAVHKRLTIRGGPLTLFMTLFTFNKSYLISIKDSINKNV